MLRNPDVCKRVFSIPRWNEFRVDIVYFGKKAHDEAWEKVFVDHGYNASPAWNLVGTSLSNLGPVSDSMLMLLSLIDPVLFLIAFVVVRWAFGGKVLAVMLIAWGFGMPWDMLWTGGAFGRSFFVVSAIVGIALIKKNRPVAGGFFLGSSALFQIFPALLFAGAAVRLAREFVRHRRWDREATRILGGAVLAASLIVPLSFSGAKSGLRARCGSHQRVLVATRSDVLQHRRLAITAGKGRNR